MSGTVRTHLLTGAGSGIGQLLAERLLARGDRVLALARSEERGAEMAIAVPGLATLAADLAEPSSVEALVEVLPERLDSVVQAAGVVELGRVADLPSSAWTDQLMVNLVAPAVLSRVVLPSLRAARGTMIFLNSGAGLRANPHWSAYAASKHGLKALADSLAAEEPEIRVTTVFPGRTATAMQEKVHAQEGKDYDPGVWIQPGTVADLVLSVLDLPADAVVPELVVKPG